jgi:hypothetical protein
MRKTVCIAAALALLGGCAHGSGRGEGDEPREPASYRLSEVDQRPVLLGCSSYAPPPRGTGYRFWARVQFTVTASGSAIEPMVTRVRPAHRRNEAISPALDVVRSCTFSPALLDGRPVAVRGVVQSFVF